MLWKRKEVGGRWGKNRSQDSGFRKKPQAQPLNPESRILNPALKVKDRRGNVYENKGSAFHRPGQSGNVIENKDSYEF